MTAAPAHPPLTTIDEIRTRHRDPALRVARSRTLGAVEADFFDPELLRLGRTRISDRVYPCADGGAFFVTSEESYPLGRRWYYAQRVLPDGGIVMVAAYRSGKAAHTAAARRAPKVAARPAL